jgi:hypothetical protein
MTERIFSNNFDVPAQVLNIRLRRYDPSGTVRTYIAEFEDGTVGHYAAVDSILTDAQIESGMVAMTQAEIDAQARFYGARDTAGLSTLLKTMTAQQAQTYINYLLAYPAILYHAGQLLIWIIQSLPLWLVPV